MINMISRLGAYVLWLIAYVGRFFLFLLDIVKRSSIIFKRPYLVVEQIYFIGYYSIIIIVVSGLFVGLVLGFQGFSILSKYGSEEALGMMVALALLRELGPVITALLFIGRAGTSITAEIGLMKAGEQIVAIDVMGISPIQRLLVPRFWGGVIAMPILALLFSVVGVIGGWLIGVEFIGIDNGAFWSQMQQGVDIFYDVLNGLIKSIVFGVACMWVALYKGWNCKPTPEGVSQATTQTVVNGSLLVLGLDFMMTAFMF